MGTQLTHISLC